MMKSMKLMLALGTVIGLSACGGSTPSGSFTDDVVAPVSSGIQNDDVAIAPSDTLTSPVSIAPSVVASDDASFARILNGYRDSKGVGDVAFDSRLNAAAQEYAQDMAANNFFSHTGRDGSTTVERIRAAGYVPRAYGENLAGRQQSEQAALDAWINSDSHRAVLEAKTFEDFGLGFAGTGSSTRWVLIMGRE